jgi:hemerythrin-like domain-containing protein
VRATDVLIKEHNSILEMLEVLGKVCDRLESADAVVPDHLGHILSFLKGFADRCHHGKEEDLLFPAMEASGIPREGGPIGVMLLEHVQGRELIERMVTAVGSLKNAAPNAPSEFVGAGRDYVRLLTQHIEKENNVLFRMADMHISESKQQELEQQFEVVDQETIGTEQIEKYLQVLEELKSRYC